MEPELDTPSKIQFLADGYEALEKVAKVQGTSGGVYVPRAWIGHRVLCIRLD